MSTEVTNPHSDPEKQIQGTVIQLEDALATLSIDPKDADEAFEFLRDHHNADGVMQEAMIILADDEKRKKLLRKIDWSILPCMIVTYFLQFLYVLHDGNVEGITNSGTGTKPRSAILQSWGCERILT